MIAARVILPAVAVPVDTSRLGQCADQNTGTIHCITTFHALALGAEYTFGREIGKLMSARPRRVDQTQESDRGGHTVTAGAGSSDRGGHSGGDGAEFLIAPLNGGRSGQGRRGIRTNPRPAGLLALPAGAGSNEPDGRAFPDHRPVQPPPAAELHRSTRSAVGAWLRASRSDSPHCAG
jgi:hypothetical protein